MNVLAQEIKKPQMNADERRFISSPQRTQRTQSIATIIFATFALFAVRIISRLNMRLEAGGK